MFKKIIIGLAFFIFVLNFKLANAEVIINELMYHDSQGASYDDWIEVYNQGDKIDQFSKDLSSDGSCRNSSDYKLIENGSNHNICKFQGDDNSLDKNEYAIIASDPDIFKTQWNFSGKIFKSNFDLTDSGKKIQIDNSIFDYTQYIEKAKGDGNSLQQMIDGSWQPAEPTPGEINKILSSLDNLVSNSNNSTDVSNNDESSNVADNISNKEPNSVKTAKSRIIENPKIKVKILTDEISFVGQPTEFQSNVLGYSNEKLMLGKLFWNFGDGSFLEQTNKFEKIKHFYSYEGENFVSLEYYSNSFTENPEAVDKIMIKVVPLSISIFKIGNVRDFFVELTNNSNYETDISGWILSSNNKNFVFPKNSIIMPRKPLTISSKLTNFIFGDQNDLKLLSSTGEIVFDYNLPTKAYSQNIAKKDVKKTISGIVAYTDIKKEENITNDDLPAEAQVGSVQVKNNFIFSIVFVFLLIGAGLGVYFIRQRKKIHKYENGEDFEILDE